MTNGITRTTTSGAPRPGARTETSMVSLRRTGTLPLAMLIKLLALLHIEIDIMADMADMEVSAMEATAASAMVDMVVAMAKVTLVATAMVAMVEASTMVEASAAKVKLEVEAKLPRVLIKRDKHLVNGQLSNPGMTMMSGPNRPTALMPTPGGVSLTTPSRRSPTMMSNTLVRSGPTTTNGPRTTTASIPATPPATRRPHLRTTRPELRPPTMSPPSKLAIVADTAAVDLEAALEDTAAALEAAAEALDTVATEAAVEALEDTAAAAAMAIVTDMANGE